MSQNDQPSTKAIWLAIFLLAAVFVASATAVLFFMAHTSATSTVAASGAAFIATVTFFFAVWTFLKQ